MKSLTNRALGVGGDANTTSVTVRLPDDVVAFIDSHFNGRIKNRSEFLQHWAQVGMRVGSDDELDEALDWALDRPVQNPLEWVSTYAEIAVSPQSLERQPPSPDWGAIARGDEVETIQESQLEAMRNRVR